MDNQLTKEYLAAAADKLDSAKILLEHEKYDDAASRAYYAAFHCAQSLLISAGMKAESHTGVQHLFSLHFVKTAIFDKKFAKYLRNLKDDREDGDYGILTTLEEKDAKLAIFEAEEFLNATKEYFKNQV